MFENFFDSTMRLAGLPELSLLATFDNGEGHIVGLRNFFLGTTPKLSVFLLLQDIGNKIDLLVAGELVGAPCGASGVRPLGSHCLCGEKLVSKGFCHQQQREGGSPQLFG